MQSLLICAAGMPVLGAFSLKLLIYMMGRYEFMCGVWMVVGHRFAKDLSFARFPRKLNVPIRKSLTPTLCYHHPAATYFSVIRKYKYAFPDMSLGNVLRQDRAPGRQHYSEAGPNQNFDPHPC